MKVSTFESEAGIEDEEIIFMVFIAEVISCPEPKCPEQMQIKLIQKKSREMSSMFTAS